MEQKMVHKTEEIPKRKPQKRTGIPAQMQRAFEPYSGIAFDDVRVHYYSDKPVKIGALAYTQGNEGHIGPGQEKHLQHELGHVVQQKTGIVRSTRIIGDLAINDNPSLERKADHSPVCFRSCSSVLKNGVVQRKIDVSVALQPEQNVYEADELRVDTIKLSGRSKTELKNSSGNDTQGDHIIADVFIKKYQKVLTKNKPLKQVYAMYFNLFSEVAKDNEAFGALRYVDLRIQESNKQVDEGQGKCNEYLNFKEPKSLHQHRKDLKEVITIYNDAYATSALSTHGCGTGGHGEKSGMESVRSQLKQGVPDPKLFTLLDITSLTNTILDTQSLLESKDYANSFDPAYILQRVINRFLSMIYQIMGYASSKDTDRVKNNGVTEAMSNLNLDLDQYREQNAKDLNIKQIQYSSAKGDFGGFLLMTVLSKIFSQLKSLVVYVCNFDFTFLDRLLVSDDQLQQIAYKKLNQEFQELQQKFETEMNIIMQLLPGLKLFGNIDVPIDLLNIYKNFLTEYFSSFKGMPFTQMSEEQPSFENMALTYIDATILTIVHDAILCDLGTFINCIKEFFPLTDDRVREFRENINTWKQPLQKVMSQVRRLNQFFFRFTLEPSLANVMVDFVIDLEQQLNVLSTGDMNEMEQAKDRICGMYLVCCNWYEQTEEMTDNIIDSTFNICNSPMPP